MKSRLPLALLVLTILALFYRLLLGETIFWGLPSLQFYPWREFAMSELAQGRLPLWNPYNGAGAPLLANYQSALLYPPHLLYFLWSGPQMMGWLGMLHIAWAGYGMWRLTGRLGCTLLGRGIATLAFPLSSTLVARFGTLPMLDTVAWLPWLILTVDGLLQNPHPKSLSLRARELNTVSDPLLPQGEGLGMRAILCWSLALTAIVAMELLAGHAQWTFYSFVLAGGYGLWKLRDKRPFRQLLLPISAAILAVLLGIGIAAAQLLPTAELQAQSQRAGGVDETFALNFSYAPLSLITLFNPNFFGNPGDGSYVINGAYFETTAYIGILPVTLAILGAGRYFVLQRRKRRGLPTPDLPLTNGNLITFFSLVTVISILLAFGSFTPIYPLLYRYVPTFKLFQAPARWLLLTVFSLTMLAALTVPLWKPDRRTRQRAMIGLMGTVSLILAGVIAPLVLPHAPTFTVQLLHGVLVLGILALIVAVIFVTQPTQQHQWNRWAAAVLIFVALDLWWANSLSNPTVPAHFYDKQASTSPDRIFWPDKTNQQLPESAFTDFLPLNDYPVTSQRLDAYRRSNLPDLNLLDRQPSLNSFEPLRPDGLDRFTKLLNDAPSPALLRAADVKQVQSSLPDVSRAWIVPDVQSLLDVESIEKAMSDKGWNPGQTAFLEARTVPVNKSVSYKPQSHSDVTAFGSSLQVQPPSGGFVFSSLLALATGDAEIVQENPQHLEISADSSQDGMLVLADTYYPGWQATIDGHPTQIYQVNLNFRGVNLSAGKHTVTMDYDPQSWKSGVIISAIALLIFAVLLAVSLVRWKRI